jgi:isopropylmalate/homocitrate/citramalate synthase
MFATMNAETITPTPWQQPGRFFTSPWNHEEAARANLAFPSRIRFHDVTLRDGEQQAGIAFSPEDKLAIARRLDAAGVDRIEAGMPIVSPQDEAAVRAIVEAGLDAEIFVFGRCMVPDVEKAKECGATGLVVEIPSSGHIIERGYGWSQERAIQLSIEATTAAREAGLYTVFFTIDSSRAEFDWYLDLVARVAEEGHMDALSCGVEVVHTTVTGIGERAGNTPMEELALALEMLYAAGHGLSTNEFFALSRLVCERGRHTVPSNRAAVGERLFEVESGIIAGWYARCVDTHPTELFPYHWDAVGQPAARIVYGKGSGIVRRRPIPTAAPVVPAAG